MSGLQELLARVEAATGPDRMIDEVIFMWDNGMTRFETEHDSSGWRTYMWNGDKFIGEMPDLPRPKYTASIDAALALVERKLPGWVVELTGVKEYAMCGLRGPENQREHLDLGLRTYHPPSAFNKPAQPMPLAILAALLRALIASEPQP